MMSVGLLLKELVTSTEFEIDRRDRRLRQLAMTNNESYVDLLKAELNGANKSRSNDL